MKTSIGRKNIALPIAFAVALSASFAAIGQECLTPLPTDFVTPKADPLAASTSLIGVWGNAKWDNVLCSTLVVESVDTDAKASVIYSYGTAPEWNIRRPGFVKVIGVLKDGILYLEFPKFSASAQYKLVDGKLEGKYITGNQTAGIVMSRVQR